jgi:hypothetical protein
MIKKALASTKRSRRRFFQEEPYLLMRKEEAEASKEEKLNFLVVGQVLWDAFSRHAYD